MIYFEEDGITIRTIIRTDPRPLCAGEKAQGWRSTEDKFLMRIADQQSGKAAALVAEVQGSPAGYINVYFDRITDPLTGQACCEIIDFGVLEPYRNKGLGTKLMDVAEAIASEHGDTVFLGVGLHSGYGSAQRMYVKRGYLPDGKGVWYGERQCVPYKTYRNDDNLMLRMSKKLR